MLSSRSQLLRTGLRSAGTGVSCARAALLLFLAAAAGGCSATIPSPTGGLFGGVVAAAGETTARPAASADLEADGREAQRPPPLRMYRKDDDPTQPFSPNYGDVPLPQQPDENTDHAPT
jgi:hypothetical protein